ncbi:MAG: DedA family protein [Gemmatimonadales bacterium]|nr:DedA family protein [Gemmatimonadales bacterium]
MSDTLGLFEIVAVASVSLRWVLQLPTALFHGYAWLLESAVDWVRALFESHGLLVVFFGTLLENTLLLGFFVPGALIILLAGVSAQDGVLSVPGAFALGLAGTVLGDTVSYFMGRFGWSRIGRGSLVTFTEKVREPILRRGPLFVLIYHFAGYTRLVGPAAAGLLRMPYRRWAVADHLGAALWVAVFLGIGYGLAAAGITLDTTDRWFRTFEWALLGLVLAWVLYLYRSGRLTWLVQIVENFGKEEPEAGRDEETVAAPARD